MCSGGWVISSAGCDPEETPPGQRHTAQSHQRPSRDPSSVCLSFSWKSPSPVLLGPDVGVSPGAQGPSRGLLSLLPG